MPEPLLSNSTALPMCTQTCVFHFPRPSTVLHLAQCTSHASVRLEHTLLFVKPVIINLFITHRKSQTTLNTVHTRPHSQHTPIRLKKKPCMFRNTFMIPERKLQLLTHLQRTSSLPPSWRPMYVCKYFTLPFIVPPVLRPSLSGLRPCVRVGNTMRKDATSSDFNRTKTFRNPTTQRQAVGLPSDTAPR